MRIGDLVMSLSLFGMGTPLIFSARFLAIIRNILPDDQP
jgi:hypothetical protein